MIEHPDREKNARIGLHIWRFATFVIAVACLWGIVDELNKKASYNVLVRDYIGGPRVGDAVLLAVIGVAAGFACWRANRALNARDAA